MKETIEFFYNPYSRARIAHWMLEECGAPYQLKVLDFVRQEHKTPEYLKVNPMGKIPAIVHRGHVITECGAICAYLADAFPETKLAPSISDPARGTYYRWLFFGAGCVEPAIVDKLFERKGSEKASALGYGTYDDMIHALETALKPGPFILGEQFSAADVYVGSEIMWGYMAKALAPNPIFESYLKRFEERPAYKRFMEQSEALAKNARPAS